MVFDSSDERWVDEAVWLVPYDPEWARRYDSVITSLEPLLHRWLTGGLHHVGSTAVPGLAAKPVVDILAGVASLERARPCIEILRDAGWWYAPFRHDDMHWFCAPSPSHRQFHLHVAETDGRWYHDELAFRDVLREDPRVARQYEALKVSLARRHPNDREAYTQGKTDFIRSTLQAAGPSTGDA